LNILTFIKKFIKAFIPYGIIFLITVRARTKKLHKQETSKKYKINVLKRRFQKEGTATTLKNFCPKLAICTYHLPNDPEVIEKIILEANPKYKTVHLHKKLFVCVV